MRIHNSGLYVLYTQVRLLSSAQKAANERARLDRIIR